MYPSSPRPFDSSRLPAYRAAHVGRFHPYPRGPRRNTEANYTPTVDYSPPLETIVEEPEAVVIRRLTVYYDEEEDSINSELSYELAEPLAGEWYPAEDVTVRTRSAAALVEVWKSILRRTSHAFLAMRVFHTGNRE